MNPPVGSPDLLEPAGPTDPAIPFLALRQPDGQAIAVFSTYSLHYVGGVGSGHISADYFGIYCDALTRLLKAQKEDPPFVALMANGTSGDINNINFRKARPRQEPYAQMTAVAEDVAHKVHDQLATLWANEKAWTRTVALAARYRELPVSVRRPTPEQLAWARKTLAEKPKTPGKADLPAIYAERTLLMDRHPEKLKLPLQVLRIGGAVIGTMPCEIFCEIGLEYKKRSPIQPAWLVSLNHGYYGYLPTPRHHDLGGYETWLGTNRLEAQASEKMLSAVLEMTKELNH
jgi:hypothetical protein